MNLLAVCGYHHDSTSTAICASAAYAFKAILCCVAVLSGFGDSIQLLPELLSLTGMDNASQV